MSVTAKTMTAIEERGWEILAQRGELERAAAKCRCGAYAHIDKNAPCPDYIDALKEAATNG